MTDDVTTHTPTEHQADIELTPRNLHGRRFWRGCCTCGWQGEERIKPDAAEQDAKKHEREAKRSAKKHEREAKRRTGHG